MLGSSLFSLVTTEKFENLKQGNTHSKLSVEIGSVQFHLMVPEKSGSENFTQNLHD